MFFEFAPRLIGVRLIVIVSYYWKAGGIGRRKKILIIQISYLTYLMLDPREQGSPAVLFSPLWHLEVSCLSAFCVCVCVCLCLCVCVCVCICICICTIASQVQYLLRAPRMYMTPPPPHIEFARWGGASTFGVCPRPYEWRQPLLLSIQSRPWFRGYVHLLHCGYGSCQGRSYRVYHFKSMDMT